MAVAKRLFVGARCVLTIWEPATANGGSQEALHGRSLHLALVEASDGDWR